MKPNMRYAEQIVWEYPVTITKNPAGTKQTFHKQKHPQQLKMNDHYLYSRVKLNEKQWKKHGSTNKSRILIGIYYALIFILVSGFLSLLTISISSASTLSTVDYYEDQIYSIEKSREILKNHLVEDPAGTDKKESENEDKSITNTLPDKIKPLQYTRYRIKKNDTVEKIARKFGVTVDTMVLSNPLKNTRTLIAGAFLNIPNYNGRLITVKANDSIFLLANRYGVSWQKIADINQLKSDHIIPGLKLFIPESKMSRYERDQYYGENFIWPLKGKITSYFGSRIDPFTKTYAFHTGLDIANDLYGEVKSAKDGKVIYTGWQNVYGNFIMIRHNNQYITIYGHLSKIYVQLNQAVKQGEIIAHTGSTGRSTGPHLHFEVRRNGKLVNPLTLLK